MSYPSHSEILSEAFLSNYKNKQPNWGFNNLGYIVYKRTYARLLEDGNTEEWWQTVERCIRGAQKIGAMYTHEEAEKIYDHIFNLKCSFAGRMLWQLGTPTVDKFYGNSLLNCWFCQINDPLAFEFIFENLMLGGGVGFSIRREDVHELPKIKTNVEITHEKTTDADFIVPDSREGWVKLLHEVLKSFFQTGKSFTYSTLLIRSAGEPIRGFGGVASGPGILVKGIQDICNVISNREGKKLRSIDVLDICNIIGSIVVAGNVRRSAQIALGDADDYLFLRAKRWDLGTIPNWRAMSNNTNYFDEYSYTSDEFWKGYKGNGEPYGMFNLKLSQTYGRLIDGPMNKCDLYPTNKDNCEGTNPCQPGFATVKTPNGIVTIDKLQVNDMIWSETGWTKVIRKINNGIKPVYECITDEGVFYGTKDHKIISFDRRIPLHEADFIDTISSNPRKILNKRLVGKYEVFDITVDNETHTYWTGGLNVSNCGEISLSNFECCNLSELFINNISSYEEFEECARLLYKTQKAIAGMPFLHQKTNEVVHKNMRLGLGITGICQAGNKLEWLDPCYKALRQLDKEWSALRGWSESIKLTTVKPSGSLSLLSGSSPGVHPGYSQYFIRRVRMSSSDSLVNTCREMGYHIEYQRNFDGSENHDTVIVEFPCSFEEGTILAKDMSAIQQLELVKRIQTEWADNAVSVTVYYKLEELESIQEWLRENYEKSIKSVSFLLHSEHGFDQAPYEEIDEIHFNKIKRKVKNIEEIMNISINSELLQIDECEGGACPVR